MVLAQLAMWTRGIEAKMTHISNLIRGCPDEERDSSLWSITVMFQMLVDIDGFDTDGDGEDVNDVKRIWSTQTKKRVTPFRFEKTALWFFVFTQRTRENLDGRKVK